MNTWQKMLLSIAGIFLGGATSFYQLHLADDPLNVRFWIGLTMAGLAPVGGYLIGFFQINPVNQPRTPEALLGAVKASELPESVKAKVAPVLAAETVKPVAEPPR